VSWFKTTEVKEVFHRVSKSFLMFICVLFFNHKVTKKPRSTKKMYQLLSEEEEWLASQVVDIAIHIHRQLGPELLESVYKKCFYYELQEREINFTKETQVPITYKKIEIDDGLRLDCLVEDLIIIEFKAQEKFNALWKAQLLSYMKLSGKRLGFLISFHVPLMKDGISRIIK
jgi:GxxExxY protein